MEICSYLQDALRNKLKAGTNFEVNIIGDHSNKVIRDEEIGHLCCGHKQRNCVWVNEPFKVLRKQVDG